MREWELERLKFDGVLELEACGGVILVMGVGDPLKTSVTAECLGINSAGNSFICLRNQSWLWQWNSDPFRFIFFLTLSTRKFLLSRLLSFWVASLWRFTESLLLGSGHLVRLQ